MRRRHAGAEDGFTLLELMLVVAMVAILLTVAVPTFLRLRGRAQDAAAKSALSDALKAERAYYAGGPQEYTDDAADLEDTQPNLRYETAVNASCAGFSDDKCVQVTLLSGQEVLLVVRSETGTYWAIRDRASGVSSGTYYNSGGDPAPPVPAAVSDSSW